jgi:hypothetical protein
VIFSADGYYSQTVIPTGRNKLKEPLEDMIKEELLNRFQLLFTCHGTYTVSGNTLTRRIISHSNPDVEGTELAQEFRVEGDMLILTRSGSKAKHGFGAHRRSDYGAETHTSASDHSG